MKDLFSKQAGAYSVYRPTYPSALYDHIVSFVAARNIAWDCATGNGQAAVALANYFKKVCATDMSAAQLAKAVQKDNIEYLQCPAEKTPFAGDTFDLVTVAQAYHWLNHEAFHAEVKRVAKQNAVVAIWMYDRFKSGKKDLNDLMDDFYYNIIGSYWDEGRRLIDNHYSTLPFPYEPLPVPQLFIKSIWTKQHLLGYLSSWSAVQNYIQANQSDPVLLIQERLNNCLKDEATFEIEFPLHLLLGRVHK